MSQFCQSLILWFAYYESISACHSARLLILKTLIVYEIAPTNVWCYLPCLINFKNWLIYLISKRIYISDNKNILKNPDTFSVLLTSEAFASKAAKISFLQLKVRIAACVQRYEGHEEDMMDNSNGGGGPGGIFGPSSPIGIIIILNFFTYF